MRNFKDSIFLAIVRNVLFLAISIVFVLGAVPISGCDDDGPLGTPSIVPSTSSSIAVETIRARDMYLYIIHDEGRKITCYATNRSSGGVGISCLPDTHAPPTSASSSVVGGPR